MPPFHPLRLLAPLLAALPAWAQGPPGYYDGVDTQSAASLRADLHELIDDHTRIPYTASATDTWDVLELACEDPSNASRIIDIYGNLSYAKVGGGNSNYNREHTWPNSLGFTNDGSTNYPYSDCHHLFLSDVAYNSARDSKAFRACPGSCTEWSTSSNGGQGGAGGGYPGDSNWTSGNGPSGAWEAWSGRRGDLARALMYMDVRYEGGTHGITGASEPDLILTDDAGLISSSQSGSNLSVAYMGELSVLLQWHLDDPVDDWERDRNDVIYAFQGNRNPFIDHPEWVDCVFGVNCAPPPPQGGITTMCFGDGSSQICPCLNWGATGRGCANSTGVGAYLLPFGSHFVAADDLVLLVGSARPSTSCVFIQGASPLVTNFRDGLLCTGNPTRRLEFGFLDASGSAQSSISIVQEGNIPGPGVTRWYQAWYRDPGGVSPCGQNSNLTNALEVVWE
ncbi:MAG: endonuclease [Planctomycetes bacterium]|nr:endonuclease [Planctomycetota bacterium]MCB9904059.1 endonuclease [Planctomycetota bacterium]